MNIRMNNSNFANMTTEETVEFPDLAVHLKPLVVCPHISLNAHPTDETSDENEYEITLKLDCKVCDKTYKLVQFIN